MNWTLFFLGWMLVGIILAPVIGYELRSIGREYEGTE